MLVRIWWKEGRTLAPIALTLAVTLAALQWFLLTYGGRDVQRGTLVPIALGWAVLYALVAGAASFAGEREARMMGFLDALPVGRGMLWLGKASFVLVSSVLLALAFRVVAVLGSDWGAVPGVGVAANPLLPSRIDEYFALLLVEAAVWGLFWSALSKNALSAGILAVLTTAGTAGLGSIVTPGYPYQEDVRVLEPTRVAVRLGVLAAALVASWVILHQELAGWTRRPRPLAARGPADRRLAATAASDGGWLHRPLGPGPAFRSLAWQAAREGRSAWLLATAVTLVLPGLDLIVSGPQPSNLVILFAVLFLGLLIQGVSVFGLENAAGTRQFLDNQAVSPRTVWAAKVATWLLGLSLSAMTLIAATVAVAAWTGRAGALDVAARDTRGLVPLLAAGANCFAVGLVGGMVFTRRITAAMLSGLAAVGVIAPQVALFAFGMIPGWSLALVPAILVAISFLWAGDWLAVRGNWRRWARLATLTAVPFVGLGLWYVGGRAWGIPDIGPQNLEGRNPAVMNGTTRDAYIAADRAIFPARATLVVNQPFTATEWAAASPEVVAAWQANRDVIDEARRLAARAGAVPCVDLPRLGPLGSIIMVEDDANLFRAMRSLATLLAWDALERRSRGDFAGGWEDILAQYRMSNQAAAGAGSLFDYNAAMRLSEGALQQALAWAREPNVSREAIAAARREIQQLGLPTMIDVLRADSGRLEAALDRSTASWVDIMAQEGRPRGVEEDDGLGPALQRIGLAWFVVPIWERERSRRILRQVTRMAVKYAENDSYESDAYAPFWPMRAQVDGTMDRHPQAPIVPGVADRAAVFAVTPLADRLSVWLVFAERDYDRELTNRRALDTFLALRSWQIEHGGVAPASLDELVPSELERIPTDPFSPSRGNLGYARAAADREEVPSPGNLGYARAAADREEVPSPAEPGPFVYLFSVGTDGQGDSRRPKIKGTDPAAVESSGDDLRFILPATIPPGAALR